MLGRGVAVGKLLDDSKRDGSKRDACELVSEWDCWAKFADPLKSGAVGDSFIGNSRAGAGVWKLAGATLICGTVLAGWLNVLGAKPFATTLPFGDWNVADGFPATG